MTGETANYAMVLPARRFRIDDRQVALENAFAEHLRMMRSKIGGAVLFARANPREIWLERRMEWTTVSALDRDVAPVG